MKIGSSLFVDIFIFLTSIVSAITLDRKFAIEFLISESEDYISKLIIAGLLVTILSKPAGYIFNIPSNILSKSLNDGDFNQNPNVNFWQIGNISWYKSLGFEISIEKNLTNEADDRIF